MFKEVLSVSLLWVCLTLVCSTTSIITAPSYERSKSFQMSAVPSVGGNGIFPCTSSMYSNHLFVIVCTMNLKDIKTQIKLYLCESGIVIYLDHESGTVNQVDIKNNIVTVSCFWLLYVLYLWELLFYSIGSWWSPQELFTDPQTGKSSFWSSDPTRPIWLYLEHSKLEFESQMSLVLAQWTITMCTWDYFIHVLRKGRETYNRKEQN
jgi:hypothetical protein